MEKQFKIGDKVKFKIGTQTYFGEVSKVTEGGCYITRKDKLHLPVCWVSNDCITKLKKKKVPTPKSSSISKKAILTLIINGMHSVRSNVPFGSGTDLEVANKIYKEWKENLK